jgi:hypothetical protein
MRSWSSLRDDKAVAAVLSTALFADEPPKICVAWLSAAVMLAGMISSLLGEPTGL